MLGLIGKLWLSAASMTSNDAALNFLMIEMNETEYTSWDQFEYELDEKPKLGNLPTLIRWFLNKDRVNRHFQWHFWSMPNLVVVAVTGFANGVLQADQQWTCQQGYDDGTLECWHSVATIRSIKHKARLIIKLVVRMAVTRMCALESSLIILSLCAEWLSMNVLSRMQTLFRFELNLELWEYILWLFRCYSVWIGTNKKDIRVCAAVDCNTLWTWPRLLLLLGIK